MMNTIKSVEENIYIPIIKQFEKECIDIELVGKTIVRAFKGTTCDGDEFYKPELEKNTLYLIAGLFHKEEPIEEIGEDLWSKDPNEIEAIIEDFKFTFVE